MPASLESVEAVATEMAALDGEFEALRSAPMGPDLQRPQDVAHLRKRLVDLINAFFELPMEERGRISDVITRCDGLLRFLDHENPITSLQSQVGELSQRVDDYQADNTDLKRQLARLRIIGGWVVAAVLVWLWIVSQGV